MRAMTKWECHQSLVAPRNANVNECRWRTKFVKWNKVWYDAIMKCVVMKFDSNVERMQKMQRQRHAKMQRWNTQCKDARCNAECSVQWTRTNGNADATKGAMPQTQPSKCVKHEWWQGHERTRERVWSSRRTTSTQWSINERLKCEEEGGKESVICVKGYGVYIVLCWSEVACAKMVKYETELTLPALFSYMVRCVLH